MEVKRFQKNTENFVCENCGTETIGDGYTNHCQACLWSKHVDVNPGDRQATCGGKMKPIAVNNVNGEYILTHTCQNCGHQKRNKISPKDDFDKVVEIASSMVEKELGIKTKEIKGNGQREESEERNEVRNPISFVARAPLGAGQQMIGSFALGQPSR